MLAITGGKGGVGKTTTALGLAAAAARAGDRPVVVDADRDCPNLAVAAGTDGKGLGRLAAGDPLRVAGTRVAGVTVLGARPGEDAFPEAADRLAAADRPVVLDCPAGAGEPTAAPLAAADRSVVVARRTRRALADGRKAAAMARRLGATPAGVVLSRAERVGRAERVFETTVLERVPRTDGPAPWRRHRPVYDRLYRSLRRQNP
ncbi:MinD/ParA family ATP-binding protein [Halosegnis marinus]|uniref:MinD/ParA family protein n=1 Tax=Halosegnis marinus TaxID=3034023 RepID=A0ABD5ZJN2_9EURY|nr:P-loop NTPase [Halosegnis sp. DT85]